MGRQYPEDVTPTVDAILKAAGELTVKTLLRRGGGATVSQQERCFAQQLQVKVLQHGTPLNADEQELRRQVFPVRHKPVELKN
jgi:hypothetical protein